MGAGHTPGPWHVGNGDIYADGGKKDDYDDVVICGIGVSGGFRSHEYSIVKAHKPEGRANARLIAAAPCMLEALQMLVADFGDYPASERPCLAFDKARAAIAKATGQEGGAL